MARYSRPSRTRFTFVLSLGTLETIVMTRLNSPRHGSVANPWDWRAPGSAARRRASVSRCRFAYETRPSWKENLCSIARPSNQ